MKAKDTVMDLTGLTVGEVGVANKQAEISFKAGAKEKKEKIMEYLEFMALERDKDFQKYCKERGING